MKQTVDKSHVTATLIALAACLLGVVTACSPSNQDPPPPPLDLDAIKAADEAYATAWLGNEPEQIMATLTEDAVLTPSGLPVLEGAQAIREFWWPAESPPTTVTEYTLDQQEVGGVGDLAFVRGTFTLRFEYDGSIYLNRGTYLSLLRRLPDYSWRISHRMWNDHPPPTD